jgi:TRAP-type mannitol/chloroaromatic compound transport system permease large subunit
MGAEAVGQQRVLAGSMFSGVFFASGGMVATKSLLSSFSLSSASVVVIVLVGVFLLGFVLDLISIVLIVVPLGDSADQDIRHRSALVRGRHAGGAADQLSHAADGAFDLLSQSHSPALDQAEAHVLGCIPFIVCQIITLGIVVAFPAVATWLPKAMYGN